MAEALLNQMYGEEFEGHSAGLEAGTLNPFAVEAMAEIGVDISRNETKTVFDEYKSGRTFSYAVSVCDEASGERCPIFPGVTKRLHWSLPDPLNFAGTHEEQLARMREVRDTITDKIQEWLQVGTVAAK
jgi:arsenate reductase